MKKMVNNSTYITCIHCKEGENVQLYAGDTEGSIHIIRPETLKKSSGYVLEKSNYNYHRLHVIQFISVSKDNQLFTIGYDQKILGFEELASKQFFSLKNPHKCLFTSICWNISQSVIQILKTQKIKKKKQELIAADEQGRIYFINIHSDKAIQEFHLYQQKILSIEIIENLQQLLVVTANFIDVLRIKRGVKAGNITEAHTGPIIDLYALIPYKLTDKKYKDTPKLISTSLDNTIRVWDPKDMQCQNLLENNEKQEISCLSYLKQANLFVTGHEDGNIKLWNIELNSCLVLDQQPPNKHWDSIQCFASCIFVQKKTQSEEKIEFLFSSGYDGKINVWEIFEKKSFAQNTFSGSIICPQLKSSIIVDPQLENCVGQIEILFLVIDEKEQNIIAAGNSGKLYYIKIAQQNNNSKISINAHNNSINILVIEGRILFSGSDEMVIKLWDLDSKQHINTLDHFQEPVVDMLIIQESGHLISCSFEGKIRVWDYIHSECIK
ncbi:WD repeat protein, partial [Ichthyophthirius multifiliis]